MKQLSGRPLLLAPPLDARNDPRRRIVARLAKDTPGLASYDWREAHCAAEADVLVAIASNADAVYRVALDATTKTRPLTTADRRSRSARPNGLEKVLAAVRGGVPEAMREEAVVGSVALSVFTRDPSAPPVRVDRHEARLDPGASSRLLDPPAIAADAVRRLPLPRAPEWEPYARRLIAAGCPLLAMAVADARLGTGRTFRGVQSSALEAMRRGLDRGAAPAGARDEAGRGTPAASPAAPADEAPTCSALCTMHMVELCNNDLALWIEHRVRWEATPCGRRRPEAFLADCYREQWQSGTFEDACVTPCETAPEGRDRLQSILRRGGCLPN